MSQRGASSSLVVDVGGRRQEFEVDSVRIGRDPATEVTLEGELISRVHVRVFRTEGGWLVEDVGSTNGSWLAGRRLTAAMPLSSSAAELRLGAPGGELIRLEVRGEESGPSPDHARSRMEQAVTLLGRDPSCTVMVDDPQVSRRHARIDSAQQVIEDLGSFNGTFVNGRRVLGRQRLHDGDSIEVGSLTFAWSGRRLREGAAEANLVVERLSVRTRSGLTLLDDVSLVLPPDTLTAVIGPSGAGKSTLLGALTGDRPAQLGRIHWKGQDLYEEYENLRNHIGLVPQDDIVHPQLKVRQALTFAARLRLPPDSSDAEVRSRVDSVIERLRLQPQSDQRIGATLSGGQRKRVSIAMELLTAPPLLFLDEPTSGLDPALDREVMTQLRNLADDGHTVLTVTHSVQALELCDRVLVLAPGGRVAFFGPPSGVFEFFGVSDYVGVFQQLSEVNWTPAAAGAIRDVEIVPPTTVSPPGSSARARPPVLRQFISLTRRSVAIMTADPLFLVLLVLMPLLLAGLAHVVPGDAGLSLRHAGGRTTEANQRLTVLTIGGALIGTALTIREVIRERNVLVREHAVGLSAAAYWASKVTVFGLLGCAQGLVFGWLALIGVPGPDGGGVLGLGKLEVVLPLALATATMAVVGLVLSMLVRTSEQAMPALVGMTMVQLVLSGALLSVTDRVPLEQLAWFAPARWNFVAAAVSVGLADQPTPPGQARDPLLHVSGSQWALEVALLVALGAAFVMVGRIALHSSLRRGAR